NNMLSSRLQTESQITRVESMTLRVWRARVESVAFGKDAPRQVTALFSTEAEAQALADHLSEFGQSQSMLVAPTSAEDHARISALGQAERLLAEGQPATPQATLTMAPADQQQIGDATAPTAVPSHRFCPACGHASAMQARFCSACGAALGQ
ncbi:MAG TPA: zinc ribbon domain-containing protein, partial [Aquabacterium sp.]|nr:zinc ribbon domain-containing protein [Aquabacterium sp.]